MAFEHPFYFLRHGETTWNAIGKTQGQLDAPLSALGRRQAADAAAIMARERVSRIVSSPLSRARHTAEAVAEATGAEISFDPELMEFHAGELQGKPCGENVTEYFEKRWDPPGGETYAIFSARAWAALARAASEPGVLIVCHGGLWRAAQEFVAVAPRLWPMPNALPIHVSPGAGTWAARVLGETTDEEEPGSRP